MSIKIQGDVVIYDDKVFRVGSGNISSRPGTPVQGMIWYNTELSRFEGYDGTAWAALALGESDQLALTLATLGL